MLALVLQEFLMQVDLENRVVFDFRGFCRINFLQPE